MNYLFIYFTGTYNTRFLTEKIIEHLLEKGDTFKSIEISKDTEIVDTDNYDIVGLGFPIHGFNSPMPFNKYIAKLKFSEGKKFFIYKNSGEALAMNNAASRIPLKIMRKKRCKFLGEYHFIMPYNIWFPFEPELIYKITEEDKKLLCIMKYNLSHGIVNRIKSNFFYDIGAFAVSIQKIGGKVNSYFYKVDGEKCVLCGLCVKNCPENNIHIKNGKVNFGHNCDMCMRCSFYCPMNAIKIGMLENWKVSNYYDLENIWNKSKEFSKYTLSGETHFYKSYMNYFGRIDSRYLDITQKKP